MLYEIRREVRDYFSVVNYAYYDSLELGDAYDVYISRYSPFIDISFSKEAFLFDNCKNLYSIAGEDFVETVFVKATEQIFEETMSSALPLVGLPALSDIPSWTYNGSNVVVGVLEADGIVDVKHTNLSGANVVARNEWY